MLAARRAASSANNDDLEAEIAAEEEALRKEREFGLELEADFERLEKKKAALAKATADARASLMDDIAADEEALREERERLAAAKEAYRLEAVHFLFDWERIHAEDRRDDLPLRDTVQPPVLTEGDKRQAAIQTPRTERRGRRASLAARRAGQMRAGRSKPTPFHLGEDGRQWARRQAAVRAGGRPCRRRLRSSAAYRAIVGVRAVRRRSRSRTAGVFVCSMAHPRRIDGAARSSMARARRPAFRRRAAGRSWSRRGPGPVR